MGLLLPLHCTFFQIHYLLINETFYTSCWECGQIDKRTRCTLFPDTACCAVLVALLFEIREVFEWLVTMKNCRSAPDSATMAWPLMKHVSLRLINLYVSVIFKFATWQADRCLQLIQDVLKKEARFWERVKHRKLKLENRREDICVFSILAKRLEINPRDVFDIKMDDKRHGNG